MFLALLISWSFAATPTTWLVKAPQANPQEFFVFAQNSADMKVSQAFSTCPHSATLYQLIKEAQFSFLSSSLDVAEKKFSQIAELKWSCDWKEDERKIITFSFFRLSQMAQTPSEQMNYLTEAIAFDEDFSPNPSIFPPPIVEMYKNTKAHMQRHQLLLPEFAKKFSSLLRNGKFISLNSLTTNTYSLRARLTFLSDSYRPETFILTPVDLQSRQVDPRPLVEGSCDHFVLAEELKGIGTSKIFFSPDCIRNGKDMSTKDAGSLANADSSFSGGLSGAINEAQFPERKKSWIERNLLWVGAVVVSSIAISLVVKNHQDSETVVTPSNTLRTQQ
jgi:hypothetical protein